MITPSSKYAQHSVGKTSMQIANHSTATHNTKASSQKSATAANRKASPPARPTRAQLRLPKLSVSLVKAGPQLRAWPCKAIQSKTQHTTLTMGVLLRTRWPSTSTAPTHACNHEQSNSTGVRRAHNTQQHGVHTHAVEQRPARRFRKPGAFCCGKNRVQPALGMVHVCRNNVTGHKSESILDLSQPRTRRDTLSLTAQNKAFILCSSFHVQP